MSDETETIKTNILIVDDEPGIQEMVSLCLRRSGYEITGASTALEALKIFDTKDFAIVLTDVMMPGEDGIWLLARLHEKSPETPVIIMTGYAQLQMAVNAIKNGAFDFIHKPFDFGYLQTVVKKAVKYAEIIARDKHYKEELENTVNERTSQLTEALEQLDDTQIALAKALNEKSAFMATISHEMRTPMNGIIGGLDLLESTELSPNQNTYLQLASKAAQNMQELVERMLAFSDSAGRGALTDLSTVNIADLITKIVEKHKPAFTSKKLTISGCAPEAVISLNVEQVTRLIDILLNNACKFTDNGGAVVELHLISDKNEKLRIAVRDTGIGIPKEKLDMIFEPFTQVDATATRRFGGAGLGLCIARNIVSQLRGNVQVESAPGHGSYFCCEIPYHTVTNGERL